MALQYLKEVDLITTQRLESLGGGGRSTQPSASSSDLVRRPTVPVAPSPSMPLDFATSPPRVRGPKGQSHAPTSDRLGFDSVLSFFSWIGGLCRSIFRSRTSFSTFLKSTLHLHRPSRSDLNSLLRARQGPSFPCLFPTLRLSCHFLQTSAHVHVGASCTSPSSMSPAWL